MKRARHYLLTALQIGVSVYLLVGAYQRLGVPLTWDETKVALWLPNQTLWGVVKPLSADRPGGPHTLASLSSWISVQLFGVNEVALRIPSLLFTAVFLILLWHFCSWLGSPFTTALLYLHLAVNEVFHWYTFYFRGYLSMMSAGLALYWIAFKWKDFSFEQKRRMAPLLLLALSACALSGTLGFIFCVVTVACLFLMDGERTLSLARVASRSPLWVTAFLVGFVLMFCMAADCYPYLFSNFWHRSIPVRFRELGLLVGYRYEQLPFFLALFLCSLLLLIRKALEKSGDFAVLFFAVSLLFLIPATFIAQDDVRGRYYLHFLVPLIVFLGTALDSFQIRTRVALRLLLIWFFVCLPFRAEPNTPRLQLVVDAKKWQELKEQSAASPRIGDRLLRLAGKFQRNSL